MAKKFNNIFAQLQHFEQTIDLMEERILELEQRIEKLIQIERNHLLRIKNNEDISDEFIQSGRKYQDLSPDKAWKLYCNKDYNFLLIDVSSNDYHPVMTIPEAIHMPWANFRDRFLEIQNKTTPILIISEDGTNSVLACEFLVKHGYFNCNNISGGYEHWKKYQVSNLKEKSA